MSEGSSHPPLPGAVIFSFSLHFRPFRFLQPPFRGEQRYIGYHSGVAINKQISNLRVLVLIASPRDSATGISLPKILSEQLDCHCCQHCLSLRCRCRCCCYCRQRCR